MPAYDFQCETCGKVEERFMSYKMFTEREQPPCVNCGGTCKYLPTFYYNSPAQPFKPIVIHKDAEGNVRFPAHEHAPVPEGYQKIELTSTTEVRRFENEMSIKQGAEAERWRQTRSKYLDGQLAKNREEVEKIIRGGKWEGVEDGKIVERHGISPRGLKFLEAMQKVSKERQERGRRSVDPAFFVEVLSNHESKTRYTD